MVNSVMKTVRALCMFAVVAVALQAMQPGDALAAASVTLSPNAGQSGTVITVYGSGFGNNQPIAIYFAGYYQRSTITDGGGNFATPLTIPQAPNGTYNVSVVGNTIVNTPFAVGNAAPPPAPNSILSVQKTVQVNGQGFSSYGTAKPGDTLNYAFIVTNNGAMTATSVSLYDQLQVGQTPQVFSSTGCSYTASSRTVVCALGDIPAGGSVSGYISTTVDPGFSGFLNNVAQAQGTNTTVATSNPPTSVAVGSPSSNWFGYGLPPYPYCGPYNSDPNYYYGCNTTPANYWYPCYPNNTYPCSNAYPPNPGGNNYNYSPAFPYNGSGQFTLCGRVSSYAAPSPSYSGAIGVDNVNYSIAPGATYTGPAFATGYEICITFTLNTSSQVVNYVGNQNMAGVNTACGIYQLSTTPGGVFIGGQPFAIGAGFNPTASYLTNNQYYCFLTNGGTVYGVLSTIPTSIHAVGHGWLPGHRSTPGPE